MRTPGGSASGSPLDTLVTLVFGQIIAFLGAWLKVVRLAVACRLARSSADQRPRDVSREVMPPVTSEGTDLLVAPKTGPGTA